MTDPNQSRAADEDFDMPSGYEGLHGMLECWKCGEMAQYKPNMGQTNCPNCGAELE
jgi:hypothetical protein